MLTVEAGSGGDACLPWRQRRHRRPPQISGRARLNPAAGLPALAGAPGPWPTHGAAEVPCAWATLCRPGRSRRTAQTAPGAPTDRSRPDPTPRPPNPVEYLATYLLQNNPQKEGQ